MSSKIDQRIVEMSFENQKFEKGIEESKKSLKEFSEALKKSEMDKGFTGLEKSVGTLSSSFSLMEQIGIGALRRIGEQAVDAGARLVKSLTLDNIGDGFSEYELKINTVRSIMNATGETADSVGVKIRELDDYADKTIYSTRDMFDNLATFTNAGVPLDKATKAMIGIANATAYAGQDARAAMYAYRNFADSIANGYMSLMDWRSISRVAKIGTQEFREEILKTAVEMGTLTQAQIDTGKVTKMFEDTLKDGWLTAEVVTEVLNKYGDATTEVGAKAWNAAQELRTFSGMIDSLSASVGTQFAQMAETIFGDLDEAKQNWTALGKILEAVFSDGLKNFNTFLTAFKKAGGIATIFQTLRKAAVAFLSAIKPIAQAFDQIFPQDTLAFWTKISARMLLFVRDLTITEETADKLRRTFAGVFAVINVGWTVIKTLANVLFEVAKVIVPITGSLLDGTAAIGDFLVASASAIKTSNIFRTALLGIYIVATLLRNGIVFLIDTVSRFVSGLWNAQDPLAYLQDLGSKFISKLSSGIKMVVNLITTAFSSALKKASDLLNSLIDPDSESAWNWLLTTLKNAIDYISGPASEGLKAFGEVVKNLDFQKISSFIVGGVLLIFVKQLSDLTGALTGFTASVTGAINGFANRFLGPKTTSLIRDMAMALGVLTASIFVLSLIPEKDISKALIGVAKAIGVFVLAYAALQAINITSGAIASKKGVKEVSVSALNLIALSGALLIMASAVRTLSKIDTTSINQGVVTLGAMLGFVLAYQFLAAKISLIPGQKKVENNLVGMTFSLLTLTGTLALLAAIPMTTINDGLKKMAIVVAVVGAAEVFFSIAGRVRGAKSANTNIFSIAVGIAALVGVLKLLSYMTPADLTQGLDVLFKAVLVIAAIEAIIGVAKQIGGGKKLESNMLGATLGILALVGLIKVIGKLTQAEITQGIITLGFMVVLIGAIEVTTAWAAKLAAGAKVQNILGAISLTLLAFAGVVKILGNLTQEEVVQGGIILGAMVGLIAALQLLVARASLIPDGKQTISVIGTMMGIIVAVVALGGVLTLLSSSLVNQETLRSAAISMGIASAAIVAIGIAVNQISGAIDILSKGSKGFGQKVKTLGLVLVSVAAVLGSVVLFFSAVKAVNAFAGDISLEAIGKFIAGLGAVTLLMIAMDRIPMHDADFISRTHSFIPGFAAMAALIISTIGLFAAVKAVTAFAGDISWDQLGKFAAGLVLLGVVVAGFTALSGPLEAAGKLKGALFVGALNAIGATAVLVLAVAGLAVALDFIAPIKDSLMNGLNILVELAGGIGRMIGAFVGGALGGVLEGIGQSLAGFASALATFPTDGLANIGALAKGIAMITGATFLDGIIKFVSGKSAMDIFGEQIANLIAAFKDINAGDAKDASAVFAALGPMASNLETFAIAAKTIPNDGGILGRIVGNNDLGLFGTRIVGLLSGFKNIEVTTAERASNALAAMTPMVENLKTFAYAAQDIPNSGGFIGDFMGENDLDDFTLQIKKLIGSFAFIPEQWIADSVSNLAAMVPMKENLQKFAEVAKDIPTSGGFIHAFLGNTTMEEFGAQIAGLVEAFGTVDQTELNAASVCMLMLAETVLPALAEFAQIGNGLKASGGIAQIFSGNTTLSEFAGEIKKFVDKISKINVPETEFLGRDLVLGMSEGVAAHKTVATDSFHEVVEGSLKEGETLPPELYKVGEDSADELAKGFKSKKQEVTKAVASTLSSVAMAAKDSMSNAGLTVLGSWVPQSIGVGIKSGTKDLVASGVEMSEKMEEGIRSTTGIHSLSDLFSVLGQWIPKSIMTGIQNGTDPLMEVAKYLGVDVGAITIDGVQSAFTDGGKGITGGITNLIDMLTKPGSSVLSTAEKSGTSMGEVLTSAFDGAVTNGIGGVGSGGTASKIKSALEKLQESIEERQFYGTITLEEELQLYEELRQEYKEGSDERKKIDREIYTRMKTIYEAQLDYIDSVRQAQDDAAKECTDLETQYNQDISDAQKEAAEELEDLVKTRDENILKAKQDANDRSKAEDEKYYNDLNTILENAERDRQSLRDDYAANQKSINEKLLSDIEEQNRAYENAVKSRADSIYASYGLFAAVEEDPETSGEELLENLRQQGAALSDWQQSLEALAARGVGDALIEELRTLGPSSKAQIKALVSLTDEQLDEYVGLFEGKYIFARIQAEKELTGLKDSTEQTIKDLNAQAAVDLETLESEFAAATSNINDTMAADMSTLKETHTAALEQIKVDLQTSLDDIQKEWSTSSATVQADLSKRLAELETSYNTSLTKINTDVEKKLSELKTKYSSSMKEIAGYSEEQLRQMISENQRQLGELNTNTAEQLKQVEQTYEASGKQSAQSYGSGLQTIGPTTTDELSSLASVATTALSDVNYRFSNAGQNAALGFASGIRSGQRVVISAAEAMAQAAVNAAERKLDEKSPSKIFEGIGKFVSQGFANGISDYAYQAEKASADMAFGPIATAMEALNGLKDEDDLTFTITPILDLSAVNSSGIASLLDTPINFGTGSSKLAAQTVQNGIQKQETSQSIVNTFNLNGLTVRQESDIDAIATKLYQKQQTAARGRGFKTPAFAGR